VRTDEGLISGAAARSRRRLPLDLGRGERDAIRLFLELEAEVLLADDRRALRVCRLLDIPFATTPRLIVDLRRSGVIEPAEARRAERLAIVGRYAREIIAAALMALHENELSGGTP
jgi:predicted nucleic acid-binding protein